MCIFAQPVRAVKNTKILVAPMGAGMQLTVYQNSVDLPGTSHSRDSTSPRKKQVEMEIRSILSQHAPGKLKNVPNLLKKYKGREKVLLEKVKQKYKPSKVEDKLEIRAAPPLPALIKNAMVLPVPSGKPITLLDFSKHGAPFIALEACFPRLLAPARRSKAKALSLGRSKTLQVHDVGNYKVSVAPDLKDLRRVDTSVFTLAPDIDKLLADAYSKKFSFVVCRIKTKSIKDDAIGYTSADLGKGKLFVPTMHGHHGHAAKKPDWDHHIYSLGCLDLATGGGAHDGAGATPDNEMSRFQAQMATSKAKQEPRHRLILGQPNQLVHAVQKLNAVLEEAKVAVDSVTGEQMTVEPVQLPKFDVHSLRRLRVEQGPNKDFIFAQSNAEAAASAPAESARKDAAVKDDDEVEDGSAAASSCVAEEGSLSSPSTNMFVTT